VTVVTLAKLLPIAMFLCGGIIAIHPGNISWTGWPGSKPLGDSVILLMFAFVGIEVALIPSGEVKNPARTVPRAIYLALVITTELRPSQGTGRVDDRVWKNASQPWIVPDPEPLLDA